jgi:hypothetical protein
MRFKIRHLYSILTVPSFAVQVNFATINTFTSERHKQVNVATSNTGEFRNHNTSEHRKQGNVATSNTGECHNQ